MTQKLTITATAEIELPDDFAGRAGAYASASTIDQAFMEMHARWSGGPEDSISFTITRDEPSLTEVQPDTQKTKGRPKGSTNRKKESSGISEDLEYIQARDLTEEEILYEWLLSKSREAKPGQIIYLPSAASVAIEAGVSVHGLQGLLNSLAEKDHIDISGHGDNFVIIVKDVRMNLKFG